MESRELKKLVENYSIDQIETCIRQQLDKGENACEVADGDDEVIATLSKAEVIKELMAQGMKFSEALRELGKRIRAIYSTEEEPKGK